MAPSGAAGVSRRPVPVPGTASSGTDERLPRWAKKLRYGTYSPKGTRWTFSNRATRVPSGPHATISLGKVVDDTVSVTPTTNVVWSARARPDRADSSDERARGVARDTTSSGHSTSD